MPKNCCVAQCHNNNIKCKDLSFHLFPQNKQLKNEWIRRLKLGRQPTKHQVVCCEHFKETDFQTTFLGIRKGLKKDTVPSMRIPKTALELSGVLKKPKERPVKLRNMKIENTIEFVAINSSFGHCDDFSGGNYDGRDDPNSKTKILENVGEVDSSVQGDVNERCPLVDPNTAHSNKPIKAKPVAETEVKGIQVKPATETKGIQVSLPQKQNSYGSLNDANLEYFTGLNRERFEILYSMLEKFAPIEDRLFWYKKDALVIALYKIRHNIDFKMMEFTFELDRKYLSEIFKEVIDKLYFVLRQIDIWGVSHKGLKFYRTILDCTELTFSTYKDHPTFKLLVGCDEMGAVNFISDAFVRSISDREIMVKSGFLDLVENGDAVLADKGFDVSDLLESKGVLINIPPFLKGKEQLSDFDVMKTRIIANRRILIKNINCRAKKNKILVTPMPKSIWPIANKIIYICFALVNFYKPIVNKN